MLAFPSPEQIIEDLNDLSTYMKPEESRPRQGEAYAAQYITDLAKKFSLGDIITLAPLPQDNRYKPYTRKANDLANVVIEAGDGEDELLLLHGHFDVVSPREYHMQTNPIIRGENGELRGLGSYDMLAGVAAILTALRDIQLANHRRVRAILVCGEENDSEGTHAAFDHSNDLFAFPHDGKRVALSTEITVEATIADPYHIVVGRPGRYVFDLLVEAKRKHAGAAELADLPDTPLQRLARADSALWHMDFNPHPNDTNNLLKGKIRSGDGALEKTRSLSTSGGGHMRYNVHYCDPSLSAASIQKLMHQAVEKAIGDDLFILERPERSLPWLAPWCEDTSDGSYAQRIQQLATQVVSQTGQQQYVGFRCGPGVADENCIAQQGIPVVCIPPQGEGEHTSGERCNVRSIEEYQIPVIHAAAAHTGLLSRA